MEVPSLPHSLQCYNCELYSKLNYDIITLAKDGKSYPVVSWFYLCGNGHEFTTDESDTVTMQSFNKLLDRPK